MSKIAVNTLRLRGPSVTEPEAHVAVSGDGILSTGAATGFPNGTFTIQVAPPVDREAWHASLVRIVRNCLSAYAITQVEDGGGLPMDLKAWLREHRQSV